jgi:hypothetical protein
LAAGACGVANACRESAPPSQLNGRTFARPLHASCQRAESTRRRSALCAASYRSRSSTSVSRNAASRAITPPLASSAFRPAPRARRP